MDLEPLLRRSRPLIAVERNGQTSALQRRSDGLIARMPFQFFTGGNLHSLAVAWCGGDMGLRVLTELQGSMGSSDEGISVSPESPCDQCRPHRWVYLIEAMKMSIRPTAMMKEFQALEGRRRCTFGVEVGSAGMLSRPGSGGIPSRFSILCLFPHAILWDSLVLSIL